MIVDSLLVNGARDVQLRYKQKDLCTLLGTQRTTLISTLDKLQDQDIIEYDSNELTIVDVCRLLDMLIA